MLILCIEQLLREKKIADVRKELCAVPQCSFQILSNVSHGDFDDGTLLKWPFRSWDEPDSYKTILLINKTLLEFFDKHLKNYDKKHVDS